jgi:hypothetical protein
MIIDRHIHTEIRPHPKKILCILLSTLVRLWRWPRTLATLITSDNAKPKQCSLLGVCYLYKYDDPMIIDRHIHTEIRPHPK